MKPRLSIPLLLLASAGMAPAGPIQLGSRRELFVDEFLVASHPGIEFRLHHPVPREIAMTADQPWEGAGSNFVRVFRDGDRLRMYYNGWDLVRRPILTCYAESTDGGRTWVKPKLGLFEFAGSRENNIVWDGPTNFTPFKDTNPACPPDERYKALAAAPGGLFALKSADGIRWTRLLETPVQTAGKFDSQNNAFWDPATGQYWCYFRGFHDRDGRLTNDTARGVRDIRVSTSRDFRTWSEPRQIAFTDSPDEQLYTNQVEPYPRAPQLWIGFPTRYIEREFPPATLAALPDPEHRRERMTRSRRYGTALTDGLIMFSRDGRTFDRWPEAFLTPGPQHPKNWVYGDCYQSLGLIEMPSDIAGAPPEFAFFVGENHWHGPKQFRRYTIRLDGFVSAHAGQASGELVTKPLTFTGEKLSLNFGTSAAGAVRVELRGEDGTVIPGFTLQDCEPVFGDSVDRVVTWKGGADISALAGKTISLRFVMTEADLYSLQFR